MNWFFIASISYFFGALTVVFDKFLLGSKRISNPPIFAFYMGVLGLITLLLAPFGFQWPSNYQLLISIFSGSIYTMAILVFFYAIHKSQASQATPLMGATVPVFSYFIALIFLDEKINAIQILGVTFLIIGGLLISFDLPLRVNKKKFFEGFKYSILAGFLFSVSYLFFKEIYAEQEFISGFIWTRIGAFVGALGLLVVPEWKKAITSSLSAKRTGEKEEKQTAAIFFAGKASGGLSSIMLNYAIFLGSVTLVNSLISLQYFFVLVLAVIASLKFPKVFLEKNTFWDWMQKLGAILVIAIGIFMVIK